jgi:phospholipid/cholesterol/gamma-HCH transport system substrate-binding protein
MAISGSELESAMEASLQDEVNAQILPLKNKTEGLISSIDSVMIVITSVFNKDARKSLTKSLTSLDKTFNTLSSTMLTVNSIVKGNEENLNEIILNFKTISTSFSESNTEIKNILYNFSSLSDSLAKADILSTLNNIDEITKQINNNEGSLGLLINDKKLYDNLQKASKELEQLLGDLKDNPGRYVSFSVIGAKNKPFTEKKTE